MNFKEISIFTMKADKQPKQHNRMKFRINLSQHSIVKWLIKCVHAFSRKMHIETIGKIPQICLIPEHAFLNQINYKQLIVRSFS